MATDKPSGPRHIAVIMDGNNRWAKARGLPRRKGHRYGAEAARKTVTACVERRIPYLTLFAFSNENWERPATEIQSLMALFLWVLKRRQVQQLHEQGVRLRFVGKRTGFPAKLIAAMEQAEVLTLSNTGTTVIVAADYGGRWDISRAAQKLANQVQQGAVTPDQIDVNRLHQCTALGGFPDPDLCIRTGGEQRISNFLLWHFAYTELYFTDCHWPDFDQQELQKALDDYAGRKRRFGGA